MATANFYWRFAWAFRSQKTTNRYQKTLHLNTSISFVVLLLLDLDLNSDIDRVFFCLFFSFEENGRNAVKILNPFIGL